MTLEETLKAKVLRLLGSAIEELRATGDVTHQLILTKADGGVDVMAIMPDVTNSQPAKNALGERIRERIARGEVIAVLMVSDTFYANCTPEQNKIRRGLGLTVEEAGKAGLVEVREAVAISLESPDFCMIARQPYRRDGRAIELTGEPEIIDAGGGIRIARSALSGWFPARVKQHSQDYGLPLV